MLPEELKAFAISYSQDVNNVHHEMDTYQEVLRNKIESFVGRPYDYFI